MASWTDGWTGSQKGKKQDEEIMQHQKKDKRKTNGCTEKRTVGHIHCDQRC